MCLLFEGISVHFICLIYVWIRKSDDVYHLSLPESRPRLQISQIILSLICFREGTKAFDAPKINRSKFVNWSSVLWYTHSQFCFTELKSLLTGSTSGWKTSGWRFPLIRQPLPWCHQGEGGKGIAYWIKRERKKGREIESGREREGGRNQEQG